MNAFMFWIFLVRIETKKLGQKCFSDIWMYNKRPNNQTLNICAKFQISASPEEEEGDWWIVAFML